MNRSQGVSRRSLLKMLGAGAAGLAVGSVGLPRVARAQDAPTFGSLHRFTLGEYEVTIIQDAALSVEVGFVAANAPEEATGLLEELNLPTNGLPGTVNILMLRGSDRLILLDTGYGIGNPMAFAPGALLPTLDFLQVAREDVTDVVLSHFHPDHIGGVLHEGLPSFPNARHYFAQAEYDFLQTTTGNQQVDELIAWANGQLGPLLAADQLSFYNDEDEVVPGLQAISTPGHSPAHMSFLLSSGGESLLNTVDVAIHQELSVRRPDFHMQFDAIPDLAVETRRATLQRAKDEQLRVLGYHFTFPGLGYIDDVGIDGFRFVPQS